MESWFLLLVTLSVAALLRSFFFRRRSCKPPPGPSYLSSIILLLTNPITELESIVKDLKSKYGPIITLSVGSRPSIFVSGHSLAHQALIQKGAIFSDRPPALALRSISSASYGPTWWLLRRNLASEVLHPGRVKSYSWARKWVLQILIDRLREGQQAAGIEPIVHFQYAMFGLLVAMCFGEKVDEHIIDEILRTQRRFLLEFGKGRFRVLQRFPKWGKIFFRSRWKELLKLRHDQAQVLIPLIKSRIESAEKEKIVAYVDTLVNLQLPEEEAKSVNGGKLSQLEIVSLCGEFLKAGTDTTSAALQWIMANLVKHPHVQNRLYDEIVAVAGPPPSPSPPLESVINEEDIQRMPYMRAVVLEGLRRHPPAHFVFPHRVTEQVELDGYMVPEGATINFMVAEMGWDPKVWEDPMEFKPERFLIEDSSNGGFDISGSKGIKMMPFGAGRRICPGSELALIHLEYFVGNLIWYFHWGGLDGYEVDLSEKSEFTIVMKNPLRACISSRVEKGTN